MCLKEVAMTCSKYYHHSRLNNQHDWGDLYEHLIDTKTFTLMMNRIFIGALKIMRKMATASIWIR